MYQPLKKEASKQQAIQKKDAKKPNYTGIPDTLKAKYENHSGFSFDDVRVHYNSDKPAQFQALAYTQGNQVYMAPRQERHLEHELGHVVQQKQGIVKPTGRINNVAVNDDSSLEAEASKMISRECDTMVTQMKSEIQGRNYYSPNQYNNVIQRIIGNNGGLLITHQGQQVSVYRGGANFVAGLNEVRFYNAPASRNYLTVAQQNDTLKNTHGISVNVDDTAPIFTHLQATRIDSIPNTLQIIQRGNNPSHYEVTPAVNNDLTFAEYNNKLAQITHTP